ncbi:TPA: DUF1983 domain-containing protein [Escherichia coli]|nr:DUF1983 domain-containing protein [Escherichia coli]
METGTGQRGDGRNAFVTREELVGLKLASRRVSGSGNYALSPGISVDGLLPVVEFPLKPVNFKATGGFGSVLLEWDVANYRGHSLTEIWRSTEDNLAEAVLVATTPGQVYGDPVDPGWSGFYWIRFVNSEGVHGPWNDIAGTGAKTQIGVQAIIDQIHEEAANSPIVAELRGEIYEGDQAFLDMWSEKADVDGITAGIGIVAGKDEDGNPVSQVAISASQLFVFDPNNPDDKSYPFAVSGGKVVIPKAMIYDAVVDTLVSETIIADEVKAGISITSPVIRSAVIQNGEFQVNSDGSMYIGEYFSVTQDGMLTARNASIRGNITADSGTLNNVTINEDCVIKGTLSAAQIKGDLAKGVGKSFPRVSSYASGTITVTIYDDHDFDRQVIIPPVLFRGTKHQNFNSPNQQAYWYSTCQLQVTQNGKVIFHEPATDTTRSFSAVLDMPAGGGNMNLSFNVFSYGANNWTPTTYISNLLVIVVKKATSGIGIW